MFSGQTNMIHSSVTLAAILKKLAGSHPLCHFLSFSPSQTTGRALVNKESGVTSCRPAARTTHQAMLHVGASQ